MPAFRTPVDVGNRALQHCGAVRLGTAGFSEVSKNASEVSFVYSKMLEDELTERFWTFAISRAVLRAIDTTTRLIVPALWVQGTTYFVGSIVSDQLGNFWKSIIPNNVGNDPTLTTVWEPYFGPLTASLYDSTTAYAVGEVVYTTTGNGTALVYLSLQSGNSDNPATATAWDATTTFFTNQVVTFASIAYMSLIDLNINNEPDLAPLLWSSVTTYAAGNKVGGSDGVIYQSVGSGNIGNDPTLDTGTNWTNTGVKNPWTTVFVGGTGSAKWLLIGGSNSPSGVGLTTLNIVYPQGAGPSSQSTSRNAYLLPAGYLRVAPQNPKTGLNPLGGPSGYSYNDWLFERGFLISSEVGPITLRFVGMFTDVGRMHVKFCEAVALRIALAVCEPLTQSAAKLQSIAGAYKKFESDAKTIDGIEDGYIDQPDDDLITVRL